jgi:hypothetical protein
MNERPILSSGCVTSNDRMWVSAAKPPPAALDQGRSFTSSPGNVGS